GPSVWDGGGGDLSPADPRSGPFLPTVVAEARRQGMGVVGMKVLAAGRLVREAPASDLLRYGAAHADTVIVGCSSVAEVRANLAVNDPFAPMPADEQRALEQRIAARADAYDTFKARRLRAGGRPPRRAGHKQPDRDRAGQRQPAPPAARPPSSRFGHWSPGLGRPQLALPGAPPVPSAAWQSAS